MEMDETSLEKVGPMMEPLVMVEKEDATTLDQVKVDGPIAKVDATRMEPLLMVEEVDDPRIEPLAMVGKGDTLVPNPKFWT